MSDTSAATFRTRLTRLGLNQSSLARLMHELGDPRDPATILRSIANWTSGHYAVPGEIWVILRLLTDLRKAKAPAR